MRMGGSAPRLATLRSRIPSLVLLSAVLGAPLDRSDFARQRASHTPAYDAFVAAIGPARRARVAAANALDEELYATARARQCAALARLGLRRHPVVAADLAAARAPPCPD
jgi:hypothetical protein